MSELMCFCSKATIVCIWYIRVICRAPRVVKQSQGVTVTSVLSDRRTWPIWIDSELFLDGFFLEEKNGSSPAKLPRVPPKLMLEYFGYIQNIVQCSETRWLDALNPLWWLANSQLNFFSDTQIFWDFLDPQIILPTDRFPTWETAGLVSNTTFLLPYGFQPVFFPFNTLQRTVVCYKFFVRIWIHIIVT